MENFYWSVVHSSVRQTPFARFVFAVSRIVFYAVLSATLVALPIHLIAQNQFNAQDFAPQSYVLAMILWLFAAPVATFLITILSAQIFKIINYIITGNAIDEKFWRTPDPYTFEMSGIDQLLEKLVYPLVDILLSPFLFVERLIDGDWAIKQAQLELAHYQEDPDYQEAIKEVQDYLENKV